MYKGIIFDLDGTLADSLESIAVAANKALESRGLQPQPIEDYKYYAGDGADTLIRRAIRAAGADENSHFEQVFSVYKEFFKKDCTYKVVPFAGTVELLKELKRKGIRTAVVSNKPHDRAVQVVEKLFGKDLLDKVVGQKGDVPKKPDPTSTIQVAEDWGFAPAECVYVGDTNVDMKTGKSAGMYTVGVLWGFRDRKELEDNHADAIVEKVEELFRLF